VLADSVPGNGETWFLGRCFELLGREGLAGVVSYSDPVARPSRSGAVVFPGHVGTIYQAHNGRYCGRTKAETKWLLPDGTLFEGRAAAKVRADDQGRAYAERMLVEHGASPRQPSEDPAAWVSEWRARICRPFWHTGNLRYVWALDRRSRRYLPESLPYPKFEALERVVEATGQIRLLQSRWAA
jgi:hypothetical protein